MTVASLATFVEEKEFPPRGVGIAAIVSGVAVLGLLMLHPMDDAKTFADVLVSEASNRITDAIVHGGFIIVLAVQLVCYAVLSARLGFSRIAPLAAFVLFAMGAAFLCGSMLIDGLVTPAVAARYLARPDKIESARTLFVLLGALVSFLMPIGLLFQSAAIGAWGWALATNGSRAAGMVAIAMSGLLVVALGTSLALANPILAMAALVGTAIWAFIAGTQLLRRG